MDQWFPITSEIMENDPIFRKLFPSQKLFYFNILRDLNTVEPPKKTYYKPDIRYADALDVHINKIRIARRRFKDLGLLRYTQGKRAKGKNLATIYEWAKGLRSQTKGGFFVQMPCYIFDILLDKLRERKLDSRDAIVSISLFYLQWRYCDLGRGRSFFVAKSELAELSNVQSIVKSVNNIYNNFRLCNGIRLFKWRNSHHRLFFEECATCNVPSKVSQLIEKWNSYDVFPECKKPRAVEGIVETRLKYNTVQELSECIQKYAIILEGAGIEYYWPEEQKWTMKEFFTRENAWKQFMSDEVDPLERFRKCRE